MAINNVFMIGRTTNDVEVTYTANQSAIAKFTLALDRGKDRDGNDRGADFPRVTVFGKTAENCERYLKKGKLVAIQGRIQTGQYKNKEGSTVYTTDVVADRVEFLEWEKKPGGYYQAPEHDGVQKYFEEAVPQGFASISEDIPFN